MWTFVSVALVVICLMSVFILGLVFGDMGRGLNAQTQRQQLLLMCLFSGVVAFSLKLGMVLMLDGNGKASLPNVLQHEQTVLRIMGAPRRDIANPAILSHAYDGPYVWQTLGLANESKAVNQEWVQLGRELFHDPRLSLNRTVSCATCHNVWQRAGADGLTTSTGIYGQKGGRNAPTVWNSAYQRVLFWDGRAKSLEEQAKGPPTNPVEMGLPDHQTMVARVRENPDYIERFARLSGQSEPSLQTIVAAIADYERTLVSHDTPYDRFVRGDRSALNSHQLRGMRLFAGLGCVACHSGPNFSEASVFSQASPYRLFPASHLEVAVRYGLIEKGSNTQPPAPLAFRVPSLRNVALTAPYFHNGKVGQLKEAVKIMAQTQLGLKYLSTLPRQEEPWRSRQIGDAEVQDLVAFLNALSDPRLARPMSH